MAAARTALQAMVDAGGRVEQLLAAIEVLRVKDREVFQACERLIQAGNTPRAVDLLPDQGATRSRTKVPDQCVISF